MHLTIKKEPSIINNMYYPISFGATRRNVTIFINIWIAPSKIKAILGKSEWAIAQIYIIR